MKGEDRRQPEKADAFMRRRFCSDDCWQAAHQAGETQRLHRWPTDGGTGATLLW